MLNLVFKRGIQKRFSTWKESHIGKGKRCKQEKVHDRLYKAANIRKVQMTQMEEKKQAIELKE